MTPDDVRAAMEGRLNTVEERTEIGQAEVPAKLLPSPDIPFLC